MKIAFFKESSIAGKDSEAGKPLKAMEPAVNRTILALVASTTFAIAAPALGKCADEIETLNSRLRLDAAFQQRVNGGRIDGPAYERLFEAARIFARSGIEDGCQAVLDGIREIASKDGVEASALTREVSRNAASNMNKSR